MSKRGDIHGITVQKGGVGKSTYANALAYSFQDQGYKTILVDLDPQATQTGSFLGFRERGSFRGENISNIANLFENKKVAPLKIKTTKYIENPMKNKKNQPHYIEEEMILDFIPSNADLLHIMEGDGLKRNEKIEYISNYLKELSEEYEKVIVDAPPSFGIITTAVLKSSNSILVPIPTKNVDTDGMVGFFEELDFIFGEYGIDKLKKTVIVPNMFDKRVSDAKATLQSIKKTPNLLQNTNNLRKLNCTVKEPFPQKSCVQEAPSYNMFLVPFIMDFGRSNMDLVLKINDLAKELNEY